GHLRRRRLVGKLERIAWVGPEIAVTHGDKLRSVSRARQEVSSSGRRAADHVYGRNVVVRQVKDTRSRCVPEEAFGIRVGVAQVRGSGVVYEAGRGCCIKRLHAYRVHPTFAGALSQPENAV